MHDNHHPYPYPNLTLSNIFFAIQNQNELKSQNLKLKHLPLKPNLFALSKSTNYPTLTLNPINTNTFRKK